jgi:hypothetical protein
VSRGRVLRRVRQHRRRDATVLCRRARRWDTLTSHGTPRDACLSLTGRQGRHPGNSGGSSQPLQQSSRMHPTEPVRVVRPRPSLKSSVKTPSSSRADSRSRGTPSSGFDSPSGGAPLSRASASLRPSSPATPRTIPARLHRFTTPWPSPHGSTESAKYTATHNLRPQVRTPITASARSCSAQVQVPQMRTLGRASLPSDLGAERRLERREAPRRSSAPAPSWAARLHQRR